MKTDNHLVLYVFLIFLLRSCFFLMLLCYPRHSSAANESTIKCIEHEREALIRFKQGIKHDRCGLLSSWGDKQDCCLWHGIRCSNRTGHIISLHLRGNVDDGGDTDPCLEGKVDPSLFELKHLKSLDLSRNRFYKQLIPKSIDSLSNLEHLNLSYSYFSGEIPPQLGNLSRLVSLDLSNNYVDYSSPSEDIILTAENLEWLSHLTLLKYIGLSTSNLSDVANWVQIVSNLPHLEVLHMVSCDLPPIFLTHTYINSSTTLGEINLSGNFFYNTSSVFQWLFNLSRTGNQFVYLDLSINSLVGLVPIELGNMTSLSYLSLYNNNFEGPIPESFSSLRSIRVLDLSYNDFYGPISSSLHNLCNLEELNLAANNLADGLSNIFKTLSSGCTNKPRLETLDLSQNQFWGSVPETITIFSSLRTLSLSSNKLNGTIHQAIGQLSMLESLQMFNNSLEGIVNQNHFINLSRLNTLTLSDNRGLLFNVSADWIPPFQLNIIGLSSCKLGTFPKWILTHTTNVFGLDISNCSISGSIPASFWTKTVSSNIQYLNMSHNEIQGSIPNVSTTFYNLGGPKTLDLSSNFFEGSIPSFLQTALILYLNDNRFSNGTNFLCPKTPKAQIILDLSNNLLSGKLPDCWMKFKNLTNLHLENNKFSGNIPSSLGALTFLQFLHLEYNSFSGDLPISLKNCTSLVILDLRYNSLTGNIPSWIGHAFINLGILNLRGNMFSGRLPSSLCRMSNIQILDLAVNRISGNIPDCIHELKAMVNGSYNLDSMQFVNFEYGTLGAISRAETAVIEWKREEQKFGKYTRLVILIDLSCNELQGNIPDGIASLKGLVSLNLSRNNLTGTIASNIGQLTQLELLDLSNNDLSGEIPSSLAGVTFLEIIDLANNNLTGKIPTGSQLQNLDPSAFKGNPFLCGPPLADCPGDEPSPEIIIEGHQEDEHGKDDLYLGLYISVSVGFISGFWAVCGTLVIKRSWRNAFFQFFDDMKDKLYILVVVTVPKALRKS